MSEESKIEIGFNLPCRCCVPLGASSEATNPTFLVSSASPIEENEV
jgi:hypothetical protein